MLRKFRYSETFGRTFQGEGKYTGIPTVWFRSWGCNFTCKGFGQSHLPEDQQQVPYSDIDVSKYKSMEELPVFPVGCDSGYSWSKKFAHLAHQKTAMEICEEIESFMKTTHNPDGKFLHPKSKQWTHMAFTGGEPMIAQTAIIEIMNAFGERNNLPNFVTVETNGTQPLREPFKQMLMDFRFTNTNSNREWFWSVSPKLSTSGEKWEKAIQPEIVAQYMNISNFGQLKYVVDGSQKSWDEVDKATKAFRSFGINWDVWIMPVGADIEGQAKVAALIAEEAVDRGYNVSARVHVHIFGNVIGK